MRVVTTAFRCFGFGKRNLTKLVNHIHWEIQTSTTNTRIREYIVIKLLKAEHDTFISKEAGCGKKTNTRKVLGFVFCYFSPNYNKKHQPCQQNPCRYPSRPSCAPSGRLKTPGFVPLAHNWLMRWEFEKQSIALSTLDENSNRTQAYKDEVSGLLSHKIPSHRALPGRIIFSVKLLQKKPPGT